MQYLTIQAPAVCLFLLTVGLAGCDQAQNEQAATIQSPTHEVVITSAGEQKFTPIKAVREVTGLGLKDAKDLVDSAPRVVRSCPSIEEAEQLAAKLRAAGMGVAVRRIDVGAD